MSIMERLIAVLASNPKLSWIITCSLFVLIYFVVYPILSDPLRDIQGPRLARFTRLWLFRGYASGYYERTNVELHEKYGNIVRIAPGEYSIDDPAAAKIIYGHGTKFVKASWYEPWGIPGLKNLFNELDPAAHAALRRKLSSSYSMSSLVSYEGFVDETTRVFIDRLSEFAVNQKPVDMGRWFQFYAFDMICKITFSERMGFLDTGTDVMAAIEQVDSVNRYCALTGVFPFLHLLVVRLSSIVSSIKSPTFVIDRWIQSKTAAIERSGEFKVPSQPTDMVSKFLAFRHDSPTDITPEMIQAVSGSNIFAGSDTTSISLSSVLYHLIKYPRVMTKLREELNHAAAAGTVSDVLTFQEAQKLPYLQATIKEALRVHPATGFTMPRVVPPGGQILLGRMFPEGTVVGINSWVSNFNKETFGDDAQTFRPERWLENPNMNAKREAYFLTFGQGSRTCVGKNISLLEITKAIPQIIKEFDFDLVEKGDWACENNWFVKPTNFKCWVKARDVPKQM